MAVQKNITLSSLFPCFFIPYKIIILAIFILFVSGTVFSQECQQMSNCKCKFSNGSIIDLTSIATANEPRFKNVTTKQKTDFSYFYNPCFPFSLSGACKNVAVCQVSNSTNKEYYNCGYVNGGFVWNTTSKDLHLIYTGDDRSSTSDLRTTNVTLVCDKDAVVPKLEVIAENPTMVYNMRLTTRCACPDLCREDHLSAGSVLVILFMIFVSLYLVLGIIHSSLTRGAHGWELIPHYEFWADFPLLVRDGCVFVMSGCKADTAYERI